jgi:hypothetical protein
MNGWKSKLDEKTGMIWLIPGHSTMEEEMEVLGKALCRNTRALALAVGVPESKLPRCDHLADVTVSIEKNLALFDEQMKVKKV